MVEGPDVVESAGIVDGPGMEVDDSIGTIGTDEAGDDGTNSELGGTTGTGPDGAGVTGGIVGAGTVAAGTVGVGTVGMGTVAAIVVVLVVVVDAGSGLGTGIGAVAAVLRGTTTPATSSEQTARRRSEADIRGERITEAEPNRQVPQCTGAPLVNEGTLFRWRS